MISVSLSARRAWIEIIYLTLMTSSGVVALRKESVDRNDVLAISAVLELIVALRKESVDRNASHFMPSIGTFRRSPQGERG